jgi:hypothetical protein
MDYLQQQTDKIYARLGTTREKAATEREARRNAVSETADFWGPHWDEAITLFLKQRPKADAWSLNGAKISASGLGDARDLGEIWYGLVKPFVQPPVPERHEIHEITGYDS